MSKLLYYLATLGPIGHMSAPGTLTSLLTFMILYVLDIQDSMQSYRGMTLCVIALSIGYFVTRAALRYLDRHDDPREIVIDEVVGSLCALMYVPHSIEMFALTFVLFRFFDIFKPWPINKAELLFGAWGILIDDVVAGLFSAGIVYVLWHYILS